ncbi:LacI family transcriptional regulator [Microbacterium mangrovi]|uniref:LacI family transcriptional regulator n=1 Tax=Microbacterium mangrovi TaxID=1348253 RepID=A0A0B2A4P7_9MICO|nr:LacI family DNA-binding transcriptional regulator [Microbacterium mangrovi]KHK98035.1 LacI family transcriptional regulator [Microbacterium mangrovi]
MPRATGVTIRDVARRAGVSITAVSHALNGKGQLSEATRAKVIAAARALDYQADAFARGLRQGRIGALGMVIRGLDSLGEYAPEGVDVFARIAGVLASAALARGYSLTLLPDISRRPVPSLAFALDGYVVMSPHVDDPVVSLLDARGIPCVSYGRPLTGDGRTTASNWADEDNVWAAQQLLGILESAGARRIAFLRGTDLNAWNLDFTETYLRWSEASGIAPRVYEVAERDGVAGGQGIAARIHAEGMPDAVLCMTGRHAAGVQAYFRSQGLRMPRDLLLAAASDSEHARSASPAITAFEISPGEVAGPLIDMLVAILDGADPGEPRLARPRLHLRVSTDPGLR